jgi:hypothetical protein
MKTNSYRLLLRLFLIVLFAGLVVIVGCSVERDTITGLQPTETETSSDADKAGQRSLDEFLAAQGTYSAFFNPPVPDYMYWYDPENLNALWPDYAGVANAWAEDESGGTVSFGTTITGTVKERALNDGRALIHVNLHAQNALVFGFHAATGDMLFGATPQEVVYDGAAAALGSVNMNIKFTNPEPGYPLPDIMQILLEPETGQEIVFEQVNCTAEGELREASGYPEGTPGSARMTQVWLAGVNPPNNPNWDGWPAENVYIGP